MIFFPSFLPYTHFGISSGAGRNAKHVRHVSYTHPSRISIWLPWDRLTSILISRFMLDLREVHLDSKSQRRQSVTITSVGDNSQSSTIAYIPRSTPLIPFDAVGNLGSFLDNSEWSGYEEECPPVPEKDYPRRLRSPANSTTASLAIRTTYIEGARIVWGWSS